MLERIETILTLLVSLVGAVSALVTTLAQVVKWVRGTRADRDETRADLEKDIVRLEEVLRQQQREIHQLREAQNAT